MVVFPSRRGITPIFGYTAPHPSGRGTLTLRIKTLPSTHYEPLRLPRPPPRRYEFRRTFAGHRPVAGTDVGLSGSWMLCLRPPSPHTPRSPVAARAHSFTTGAGFAFVGRLAAPTS